MQLKYKKQQISGTPDVTDSVSAGNMAAVTSNAVNGALTEYAEKESYSTDEVKTNRTWIDGKPIYKNVLSGLNISFIWVGSNFTNASTSILVNNIDTIIKSNGLFNNNKITSNIDIKRSDSGWTLNSLQDYTLNTLIIEYTKNN